MTILVDRLRATEPTNNWPYYRGCHLFTDDGNLQELHNFARRLGLRREWFQGGRHPHYDLTTSKRRLAVKLGAREVCPYVLLRYNI